MRVSDTFKNLPAIKARQAIPEHKRKSQWRRTLLGAGVFLLGLAAPWKLGFPWQAGLGIAAFGGFIASKELVTDFLKVIPQALGAIAGALSGRKPDVPN
jgi:hypothetical protein